MEINKQQNLIGLIKKIQHDIEQLASQSATTDELKDSLDNLSLLTDKICDLLQNGAYKNYDKENN